MSNEEKLKLIIKKAVDNGMKEYDGCNEFQFQNFIENIDNNLGYLMAYGGYYAFIFSKSFLKAYFGEEIVDDFGDTYDEYVKDHFEWIENCEKSGIKLTKEDKEDIDSKEEFENAWGNEIRWEYFAKELVLADDRIDYLYKKL